MDIDCVGVPGRCSMFGFPLQGAQRQAEQGKPLPELLREPGIVAGTYYRWKSKYGGLELSQRGV